jgi:hypothetical protein
VVVIKWQFADLVKEGVTAANLVFGALLSAYVGVSLSKLPHDVDIVQATLWFFEMFWFVFSLNLSFMAVWAKNYKPFPGYILVVILSGQGLIRGAAQFGLDWRMFASVLFAWALSLMILSFMLYAALRGAAAREH